MTDPKVVAAIQAVSGDPHDPHRVCYGCKRSEVGMGGFYYCDACFEHVRHGQKPPALGLLTAADQALERAWEKNR